MPNQLAQSKRRQSLAEHKAVLDALAAVAEAEHTTVAALLRRATRELVRSKLAKPSDRMAKVPAAVWACAPRMPSRFRTAAQLARFKREQREFDQVVLDLHLTTPEAVQQRNSIAPARCAVRILELEATHAEAR